MRPQQPDACHARIPESSGKIHAAGVPRISPFPARELRSSIWRSLAAALPLRTFWDFFTFRTDALEKKTTMIFSRSAQSARSVMCLLPEDDSYNRRFFACSDEVATRRSCTSLRDAARQKRLRDYLLC